MPAVSPVFLKTSVYIYPSIESALEGDHAGGSGFVASVGPGPDELYVVTNAHVILNGNRVIRFNREGGDVCPVETRPEEWTIGPDDDLAVYYLGEDQLDDDIDVTAIPIEWGIGEDMMHGATYPLFPGDTVVFMGRFIGHDGRQRNKPVLRSGIIAMLADGAEPVRVGSLDQIAFLVECRSLSGFSGSPAFVQLADSRWVAPSDNLSGWIGNEMKFLGVDCAHIPFWAPVCTAKNRDASKTPREWVETNSGMSVVIPAWRLRDLLHSARISRGAVGA